MQIVGAMSGGGRFVDSAHHSRLRAVAREGGRRVLLLEEGAPAGQHTQESGILLDIDKIIPGRGKNPGREEGAPAGHRQQIQQLESGIWNPAGHGQI